MLEAEHEGKRLCSLCDLSASEKKTKEDERDKKGGLGESRLFSEKKKTNIWLALLLLAARGSKRGWDKKMRMFFYHMLSSSGGFAFTAAWCRSMTSAPSCAHICCVVGPSPGTSVMNWLIGGGSSYGSSPSSSCASRGDTNPLD